MSASVNSTNTYPSVGIVIDADQQVLTTPLVVPPKAPLPQLSTPMKVAPSNASKAFRHPCWLAKCVVCKNDAYVINNNVIPLCHTCALTTVPQAIAHSAILHRNGPMLIDVKITLEHVTAQLYQGVIDLITEVDESCDLSAPEKRMCGYKPKRSKKRHKSTVACD